MSVEIVRLPHSLRDQNLDCAHHNDLVDMRHRGPFYVVVLRDGYAGDVEFRLVCDHCLWRYCETCNHDGHRCPGCGTVADHWNTPCPECVVTFEVGSVGGDRS